MNKEDIDFILSHFQDQIQLFPRKMMTYKINYQFSIASIEEIFDKCSDSGFTDCRINAYSEYTEYKGIVRQPPNFIFIDMDLSNFGMDRGKLDIALRKTLRKISEYRGFPTVLWTGNGYHIYMPIKAMVLDQEEIFSRDKFPSLFTMMGKYSSWSVSEVFLKYVEVFFTKGKADPLHKPKYKSCLIRIPNSYNSKLLKKGISLESSKVEVIQRWNGQRIPIQLLLRDFRCWITQEEINHKLYVRRKKTFQNTRQTFAPKNNIDWIEKLLQISLEDNRKYCLLWILVPYFINIKNLSHEESLEILEKWLSNCSKLRPLDFNPSIEIKNRIRYVKDYKPLRLSKLKEDNLELYDLIRRNSKEM
ncbi:MAG: DNA primase noncatalytic subunit PriX [Candidatus Nitrosocosmicus sp.]|nr:DNA primase noncatalytic subunit PriX [Candidatus Nitrosocosmicus sp.]